MTLVIITTACYKYNCLRFKCCRNKIPQNADANNNMTNLTSRYTCSGRTTKVKQSDRSRVEHLSPVENTHDAIAVNVASFILYLTQNLKITFVPTCDIPLMFQHNIHGMARSYAISPKCSPSPYTRRSFLI